MKDSDSEGEQYHQKQKNKQYTGQNDIRKHTLHNVIHERIHDVIMKPLTNLLFSYVLDDSLNECVRERDILSGRFFRHF
jgi:hypothetical protein